MTIKDIFQNYRNIAVYGASANTSKFAYRVPAFIASKGYNILPINPATPEILGKKVAKTIMDVEEKIEILNVFRPSDEAVGIVQEAIERKNAKGDIAVIWLQEGIYNEEAKKLALDNGFVFVQDKCMHVEYLNNM
jgi:predicted CoA-binding protein